MTALDDELDDLLDEVPTPPAKGRAVPLRRSPAVAARQKAAADLAGATKVADQHAARLAQIVNLVIAGHSLAAIGAQIGATEAEVDRLLNEEATRYVRNQPALRTYVRNWISAKYSGLLDAVYDDATDKTSKVRFEAQDRSIRILKEMSALHGAAAPTQTEVKIEAVPESVERVVKALAAGEGLDYDDSIFDVVPGSVVHAMVDETETALAVSGNAVEESDGDDDL